MRGDTETIVIGGSQAGLTVGYHLKRLGRPFVILEASARIGDAWRSRWDSLRLFTPAKFDGLAGLRFPGPANHKPTKDEMADYLHAYAQHIDLPVRTGARVSRVSKSGGRLVVDSGDERFEADNVVVATGASQVARVPAFANELDTGIVQLHSSQYRNPSQLQDGPVLVVGAGNSGAEISMELAPLHPTFLAGKESGHVPFDIDSFKARFLVYGVRFVGHHVLTRGTPVGRKLAPKLVAHGVPLVRVKPKWLVEAGIERVPRVSGVQDGMPLLQDGRTLAVRNVVWCTGFRLNYSWIDLPVFDETGVPVHQRGVATAEPGLSFMGLPFQYAVTSETLPGMGRDAAHIARHIAARARRNTATLATVTR